MTVSTCLSALSAQVAELERLSGKHADARARDQAETGSRLLGEATAAARQALRVAEPEAPTQSDAMRELITRGALNLQLGLRLTAAVEDEATGDLRTQSARVDDLLRLGRRVLAAEILRSHGEHALRTAWTSADALRVGHTLFDPLPPETRVARGAAVLCLCCEGRGDCAETDSVIELAVDPTRWNEGHAILQRVRTLTLAADRTPSVYRPDLLPRLVLAECVAKTAYNASGRPAPFDADSPAKIAPAARHFAHAVADPDLEDALWRALVGLTG